MHNLRTSALQLNPQCLIDVRMHAPHRTQKKHQMTQRTSTAKSKQAGRTPNDGMQDWVVRLTLPRRQAPRRKLYRKDMCILRRK
jgi:hypothetical protein